MIPLLLWIPNCKYRWLRFSFLKRKKTRESGIRTTWKSMNDLSDAAGWEMSSISEWKVLQVWHTQSSSGQDLQRITRGEGEIRIGQGVLFGLLKRVRPVDFNIDGVKGLHAIIVRIRKRVRLRDLNFIIEQRTWARKERFFPGCEGDDDGEDLLSLQLMDWLKANGGYINDKLELKLFQPDGVPYQIRGFRPSI